MMDRVLAMVALVRPTQWVKNFFVFAALIFAGRLLDPEALVRTSLAFGVFCALASAAYVLNDLVDLERDRLHPEKRHRPLPAGRISPPAALATGVVLAAGGFVVAVGLGPGFAVVAVAYVVLQLAYSLALKRMVILDVMALSLGFVLRAVAGGVAIHVTISPWLVICTFLLALLLGFGKRRHEIVALEEKAEEHRASLGEYGLYFLDQMMGVVTASTVVAYAIYTASPEVREKLHTEYLYATVPFVLYGIFRYLYLVHQQERGGNPTQLLLTDRPLLVNVALWIATVIALLYL